MEQVQQNNTEQINKVFVVSWEYDTGGGFDWYFMEDKAKLAFEKEKENCEELKNENWEAAYFEFETQLDPQSQRDELTDEIDLTLPDLHAAATIKFKAN